MYSLNIGVSEINHQAHQEMTLEDNRPRREKQTVEKINACEAKFCCGLPLQIC